MCCVVVGDYLSKIVHSVGLDLRVVVMLITAFNAIIIGCRYFTAIITCGVGKNGSSVAVSAINTTSAPTQTYANKIHINSIDFMIAWLE